MNTQHNKKQALSLYGNQTDKLDLANLVEEIESMGKNDKRRMLSQLRRLLARRLKWAYEPEHSKEANSWAAAIIESRFYIDDRFNIEDEFVVSPSLIPVYHKEFEATYQKARILASEYTGRPLSAFPEVSPWTPEQVMNKNF